jgi:hypothetical protein
MVLSPQVRREEGGRRERERDNFFFFFLFVFRHRFFSST